MNKSKEAGKGARCRTSDYNAYWAAEYWSQPKKPSRGIKKDSKKKKKIVV